MHRLGGECNIRASAVCAVQLSLSWSCTQDSNTESKLSDISAALSASFEQDCSCPLSVQQHFFSCVGTEDSKTVVYLAVISYATLPGVVDVPSLITAWVASGRAVPVNSIQLQVDTTCPAVIDSLEPQSCSAAPPTDPPVDITVIAAATGAIVLLVVVTIIVAIVIAVAVVCKKQSKYRYVPIPLHHFVYMAVSCWITAHVLGVHCGGVLLNVVVTARCAGPTVPSPTRCTSMSTWTVGLEAWSWLI